MHVISMRVFRRMQLCMVYTARNLYLIFKHERDNTLWSNFYKADVFILFIERLGKLISEQFTTRWSLFFHTHIEQLPYTEINYKISKESQIRMKGPAN